VSSGAVEQAALADDGPAVGAVARGQPAGSLGDGAAEIRLLEEVRRRGYAGGYTVLRQRIKRLRTQCHRPPVERFETGPGVQAQMDWATYTIDFTQEGRRKVQLFSYVLGYSRRQYIHFTASAEVADMRVHRQRRRRPIDLHAEELPHLIPLPERPYEVAEVVYRTVDAEGFISYGQNRYSAPWHYLGQVLAVRITDEAVAIYSPRLELSARHIRFPATERHRQSQQPEHLPPRDLVRRREVLRERFAELGALAVRFLEGLLSAQGCGWDHAQKVPALLGIYRREDLLAALERAVRYGAFSAKSIERILAVRAVGHRRVPPPPREPCDGRTKRRWKKPSFTGAGPPLL